MGRLFSIRVLGFGTRNCSGVTMLQINRGQPPQAIHAGINATACDMPLWYARFNGDMPAWQLPSLRIGGIIYLR